MPLYKSPLVRLASTIVRGVPLVFGVWREESRVSLAIADRVQLQSTRALVLRGTNATTTQHCADELRRVAELSACVRALRESGRNATTPPPTQSDLQLANAPNSLLPVRVDVALDKPLQIYESSIYIAPELSGIGFG